MNINTVLIIGGSSGMGRATAESFYTDKFMARNREVVVAMKNTSPVLTSQTTMWLAWIGFNASHSLGAIVISIFYLLLAIEHMDIIFQSKAFIGLAVVIGLSYLYLAKRYWFRIPFLGILVATICFTVAAISVFGFY